MKILVVTHKNVEFPKIKEYYPISVGKNKVDGIQHDDIGENIASKNENYCELTALYWAWKNMDSEVIGLCHYRRYFNFFYENEKNKDILFSEKDKYLNKTKEKVENILEEYDIILPKKYDTDETIEKHYINRHSKEDWNTLLEVLREKYPVDYEKSKHIFNEKDLYCYNMFICKKEIFDKYMEWLFDILFEVEKRIKISDDFYQKRVFGFMSERMLHLYVKSYGYKIKELPIIMLHEKIEKKSKPTFLQKIKKSIAKRIR